MSLPTTILTVNLTDRTVAASAAPPELLALYQGGRGLNAGLLRRYISGRTDALSPQSPLLITAGRLTGSPALSSARVQVSAVSPLTGFLGNSNAGGYFGPTLAAQGILSLVITGQAATPVYLVVDAGRVTFAPADHLWGQDTYATRAAIRAELGDPQAPVAVIGPAGEQLVRYAAVLFNTGDAAGRTGMGAVLGSKRVKAIALRPAKNPASAVSPEARELLGQLLQKIKAAPDFAEWAEFGDSGQVKWLDDFGAGPAYNFKQTNFPAVERANGFSFRGKPTRYHSCFRCPVHCKAEITADAGRHAGFTGQRPPFEPMAAFGPKVGNEDALESVYLHSRCNYWGMDSLETASLLAFAMDLFQAGILTLADTAGDTLNWGDAEALERLLDHIARRDTPLGDALAEGLVGAAARLGRGSERYAYHVKGMAMTSMDPRGFKGTGLGYAVSSRGADFANPYPSLECGYTPRRAQEILDDATSGDRRIEAGKGKLVRYTASVSAVLDALGLCKIPYLSLLNNFTLTIPAELLSALSGDTVTAEGLLACGERIVTTERLLNLRLGLTRADDTLPAKFRTEPISAGDCAGLVVDIDPMVSDFYREMGWDAVGVPTPARLAELGLSPEGE